MIDVANNLFSALSPAYRNSRLPSSVALAKPSAANASGNSLKAVSDTLRQDTGVANFAPPPEDRQGFASLSSVLESIRLPPAALNAANSDTPPLWESLLKEQELIADARVERRQEFADLQQNREDEASRQAANEERAREVRANILLTRSETQTPDIQPEDAIRPVAAQQITADAGGEANSAEDTRQLVEKISLPGEGNTAPEENTLTQPPLQTEQQSQEPPPELFPPQNEQPQQQTSEVFSAEQERLQRLFFASGTDYNAETENFSSYA